jgi:hypothetical protein
MTQSAFFEIAPLRAHMGPVIIDLLAAPVTALVGSSHSNSMSSNVPLNSDASPKLAATVKSEERSVKKQLSKLFQRTSQLANALSRDISSSQSSFDSLYNSFSSLILQQTSTMIEFPRFSEYTAAPQIEVSNLLRFVASIPAGFLLPSDCFAFFLCTLIVEALAIAAIPAPSLSLLVSTRSLMAALVRDQPLIAAQYVDASIFSWLLQIGAGFVYLRSFIDYFMHFCNLNLY